MCIDNADFTLYIIWTYTFSVPNVTWSSAAQTHYRGRGLFRIQCLLDSLELVLESPGEMLADIMMTGFKVHDGIQHKLGRYGNTAPS